MVRYLIPNIRNTSEAPLYNKVHIKIIAAGDDAGGNKNGTFGIGTYTYTYLVAKKLEYENLLKDWDKKILHR